MIQSYVQTVDPAAGTLSRELSLMTTGYDFYLDIVDSYLESTQMVFAILS